MNAIKTRIPLAIALTSALAFSVGCDNRVDDRTDMPTAAERDAQATPPAGTMAHDQTMTDGRIGDGRDSDQPIDDTWITTKVKSSLLADSEVAGLDVEVDTLNGVVTLSGQVDQQSQIDHATRIARDIEGVTDVQTAGLTVR